MKKDKRDLASHHQRDLQVTIQHVREIIEGYFDIHLSLSDRMYLRKYVLETLQARKFLSSEDRQCVDPLSEATGKYIMVRYGIYDVKELDSNSSF